MLTYARPTSPQPQPQPQLTLAALADPTRREIFERLAARPQAVGELAGQLPVSRPAVSQHLRVLRAARLVRERPEGARRIYQVDGDGVAALQSYLDTFWNRALIAFKQQAETPREKIQ